MPFNCVFICCHVTADILCLFLNVPWVGPWSVIVAFCGHICAHFLPFL